MNSTSFVYQSLWRSAQIQDFILKKELWRKQLLCLDAQAFTVKMEGKCQKVSDVWALKDLYRTKVTHFCDQFVPDGIPAQ